MCRYITCVTKQEMSMSLAVGGNNDYYGWYGSNNKNTKNKQAEEIKNNQPPVEPKSAKSESAYRKAYGYFKQ